MIHIDNKSWTILRKVEELVQEMGREQVNSTDGWLSR